LVKKAKATYFVDKIQECSGDQKKLFQIVDKLLGRGKDNALPQYTDAQTLAQTFNNYFVSKITNIRSVLAGLERNLGDMHYPAANSSLNPPASKLLQFRPTNAAEITEVISNSSKATCLLDPIPTSLLRQVLPAVAPVISDVVNEVLRTGLFPSDLKSAIILPLLKKRGSDHDTLSNFRPVSNLPFISKVIEKVVSSRLLEHMNDNNLFDPMQSAYRAGHSTETALLRVHNDIVSYVDGGQGVFLVLLDLSAAFDTVDHNVLLGFLKEFVGLGGPVLKLFETYLSGRTQCVSVDGAMSEFTELAYGVPQGSVLGPILFCIYTTALGAILRNHNIGYHIYADDTQLYCPFDIKSPLESMLKIQSCISEIRSWMIQHKLKINDDKTEFLVITSKRANLSENVELHIGQEQIKSSTACKSLGVQLDQYINMEIQVKNTCRAIHFHLRNIRMVRDLLTPEATAQLVHSLITSRLDYCNSLLYGLPDVRTGPLRRVQNIAARLVTGTPTRDHITPVLKALHWLPIKPRILFKLLLITYKCIHDLAPSYLCSLVVPDRKDRVLRSNSQLRLKVPNSRLVSYGDRSFCVAAAIEWNKLPFELKSAPTITAFKSKLKRHLFESYYC